MAFSSSILPLNPLLHPSPSPISSKPLSFTSYLLISQLQTRVNAHKRDAHIPSHTLPSPSEEYPGPGAEPPPAEAHKRKRKKKPRPNFYEQAMIRWSAKVSSQRSLFPWQEKVSDDRKDGCFFTGTTSTDDLDFENGVVSGSCGLGGKSRDTHLVSEADTRDGMTDVGLDEEGLNARKGSTLGTMSSLLGHGSSDSSTKLATSSYGDEEELSSDSSYNRDGNRSMIHKTEGISLGSRSVLAPWEQGRKPRKANLNSTVENKNDMKGYWFDEEHEKSTAHSMAEKVEDQDVNDSSQAISVRSRTHMDSSPETWLPPEGFGFNGEMENSGVGSIVSQLRSSLEQENLESNAGESLPDSDRDIVRRMTSVSLPWERKSGGSVGESLRKKSNTELAERTIPEIDLRRLRNVALRMKERIKVGPAGVTEAVVDSIHNKWRESELVKLRFEGAPCLNMKRTHEILEMKTGGLVIWRSGSSVVLYRGMTYELPCARSYSRHASSDSRYDGITSTNDITDEFVANEGNEFATASRSSGAFSTTSSTSGSTDTSEIDSWLDQLGPRYRDWSGRSPLPVDADLLPGAVAGYEPPYRLLPYKTKISLRDKQMTSLRRLAREMPPHFALGRNRQHQGLAQAMVKLWDKSAIAKIAIKRGVPNTCNDRMAEEIKKLTGGILISRNKDYIVFYRGNDFLTPAIRQVLVEKQKLAAVQQDQEEIARLEATSMLASNARTATGPLVAGTLAETVQAKTHWGSQPSNEEREYMRRDLALSKHAGLVRYLERKLSSAKAKVAKAEKALAKVQELLQPANLPTDLEILTDEERFLFRKIGLKMRAFLLVGKRDVFDGTIENMHLHWKHREVVKILVKRKSFAQAKHIAISLEAESGGVLISLDKTTKGYAIIIYRGKNYLQPVLLKPRNLLTRRQALARSIELQRREALSHHILDLQQKIQNLKSQLDEMCAGKEVRKDELDLNFDDACPDDDDVDEEGEEAYLQTYDTDEDEDNDAVMEEL